MIDKEPALVVGRVWNWLPVFRAVAETEHLPTAAAALFVTPSALSRTIGLLEKEVGRPLFRRVGRRIELNAAGESLLARVRDSMRLVHHGVLEACDETLVGPLRIFSGGVITPVHVEPSIERLRAEHPQLITYLRSVLNTGIVEDLLRGRIDLAFASEPVASEHVVTENLGEATNGVYCGPGHPLFKKRRVSRDDILAHPFAAPVPDAAGQPTDGWPARLRRRIGLYADHMAVGIRACAKGWLVATLPDAIGEAHGLRRLPMDEVRNSPMYAMHRQFLAGEERAALFLDYVRAHIDARAGRRGKRSAKKRSVRKKRE
jgi:DNA-binding transcriptional LysR family regulator